MLKDLEVDGKHGWASNSDKWPHAFACHEVAQYGGKSIFYLPDVIIVSEVYCLSANLGLVLGASTLHTI